MLGCGGRHAFAHHEILLLLFSHFVRRIVQICRFFYSTSRERGLLSDVLWMDTSRPMLAARSRTMTGSRSSRILAFGPEPRLQCRCCQVCQSDNRLLLLCHLGTRPRPSSAAMVRYIITSETTLRRSPVNKVVQVASASTTCVGLHPSVLEPPLILAEWAKLVGRLGVRCGVLSEFTPRWRGPFCYFTRVDCGANALTVCNTVGANVLLDSRSEWMAARGVEEITRHEEICVQYDRALHVHIAPPTRTQSLGDTIGLVHDVLEVDGSPVLLTTRLKGSATMSLVRREPLRVDMVEALESGDCVEAVSWT